MNKIPYFFEWSEHITSQGTLNQFPCSLRVRPDRSLSAHPVTRAKPMSEEGELALKLNWEPETTVELSLELRP